MIARRTCLKAGGLALAGLFAPAIVRAVGAPAIVEIAMRAKPDGSDMWFDPIGAFVEPGQTVRWTVEQDVHTSTAYHPKNDNHSLRIPERAQPWDSGYLVEPGSRFEVTLRIEGVYDFFCAPHEQAGMVGRLVVGHPGGPGTRPFDYFKNDPAARNWLEVPQPARAAFPAVERIVRERIVHRG